MASYRTRLYRDIKMKDGTVLPKGMTVSVVPLDNHSLRVITSDRKAYRVRYSSVYKPPSLECLMQQEFEHGCVESIRGCMVEPDGHDEFGFPSWLLALGVI